MCLLLLHSRGEIKCWTSNFNKKKNYNNSKHSHNNPLLTRGAHFDSEDHSTGPKMFSLLHTFKGHAKAVTALRLHPVSGLAISTGMDGFLKVLNLEALNELFCFQIGAGIVNMRIINVGNNHHGVLMSTTDATIKLWKITSVCDFFGVASARINRLEVFENLEAELEQHHKAKWKEMYANPTADGLGEHDFVQRGFQVISRLPAHLTETAANAAVAALAMRGSVDDASVVVVAADQAQGNNAAGATAAGGGAQQQQEPNQDGGLLLDDKILVTYSTQDLRAFSHKGTVLGRLEPEHVVEGIKDFCVSVYQKLLICLCEGDLIRVHDIRRFTFPLLHEFSLRGPLEKDSSNGTREDGGINTAPSMNILNTIEDLGICCELVDVAPATALRAPRYVNSQSKKNANAMQDGDSPGAGYKLDVRGQRVPDYLECYILIGMKNGAILFLDTFNNFEVQMNFQATNGIVQDMKYRRRQRELVVLGQDFSQTFSTIRIWRLPDMDFLGEIVNLRKISCFNISPSLNFIAVGLTDGNIRLFAHDPELAKAREIIKSSEGHNLAVSSITFCDDLRIICTSSLDGRVKIWDYDKHLVRTIQLNLPTCAVVHNDFHHPGDFAMVQNHYILTIPRRIWDEDDVLLSSHLIHEADNDQAALDTKPLTAPTAVVLAVDKGKDKAQSTDQEQTTAVQLADTEGETRKKSIAAAPITRAKSTKIQEDSSDDDEKSTISKLSHDTQQQAPKIPQPPIGRAASISDRRTSKRIVRQRSSGVTEEDFAGVDRRKSVLTKRKSILHKHSITSSNSPQQNRSRTSSNDGAAPTRTSPVTAAAAALVPDPNEEIEKRLLIPSLQQKLYRHISRQDSNRVGLAGASPPRQASLEDTLQLSSSIITHSQAIGGDSNYSQVGPIQSLISTNFHVHQQQRSQYQEPLLPILGGDNKKSDAVDVLHPRFLIHSKPPARLIRLEDIDSHLANYAHRMGSPTLEQQHPHAEQIRGNFAQNVYEQEQVQAPPLAHRMAQFGLTSPRARMTLLNSSPFAIVAQPVSMQSSTDNRSSMPRTNRSQQQVCNKTDGKSSPEDGASSSSSLYAQERVFFSLAVGMQVSSQYREHRASLTQAREKRLSVMNERLSELSLVHHKPPVIDMDKVRRNQMLQKQELESTLEAGNEEADGGENNYSVIITMDSLELGILEGAGAPLVPVPPSEKVDEMQEAILTESANRRSRQPILPQQPKEGQF